MTSQKKLLFGMALLGVAFVVTVQVQRQRELQRGAELAGLYCAACHLEPTPDIIKSVRKGFSGILVAFALQAGDDLKPAWKKLREKGADYIVVNRYDEPGAGFESETNHAWILSESGGERELSIDSKPAIARKILEHIAEDRAWSEETELS